MRREDVLKRLRGIFRMDEEAIRDQNARRKFEELNDWKIATLANDWQTGPDVGKEELERLKSLIRGHAVPSPDIVSPARFEKERQLALYVVNDCIAELANA